MGMPYTGHKRFEATPGMYNAIALPMPYRGRVMRLIVTQVDGPLDGYTFDLLDREDACYGAQEDSANPNDTVTRGSARALHKIHATRTVPPAAATDEQFDMWLPYLNQDERPPLTMLPTRALYIDLQPSAASGPDLKVFEVAYTVEFDELA